MPPYMSQKNLNIESYLRYKLEFKFLLFILFSCFFQIVQEKK